MRCSPPCLSLSAGEPCTPLVPLRRRRRTRRRSRERCAPRAPPMRCPGCRSCSLPSCRPLEGPFLTARAGHIHVHVDDGHLRVHWPTGIGPLLGLLRHAVRQRIHHPSTAGPLRAYQDNCYLNRPGFNPQPDLAGFYPWPPAPGAAHPRRQRPTGDPHRRLPVNAAVTNADDAGSVASLVPRPVGDALRGATVVVFNPFGKVVGETLTGGQGKYTVTNVLAARFSYTVCVNGSAATEASGCTGTRSAASSTSPGTTPRYPPASHPSRSALA